MSAKKGEQGRRRGNPNKCCIRRASEMTSEMLILPTFKASSKTKKKDFVRYD
jgi:hypothetical protein